MVTAKAPGAATLDDMPAASDALNSAVPRFGSTGPVPVRSNSGRQGPCRGSHGSSATPLRQKSCQGVVYLNNRYHDPVTAQFISVDPLVTTTDQPYIYGAANPATLSDPDGLCAWSYIQELGCYRSPGGNTGAQNLAARSAAASSGGSGGFFGGVLGRAGDYVGGIIDANTIDVGGRRLPMMMPYGGFDETVAVVRDPEAAVRDAWDGIRYADYCEGFIPDADCLGAITTDLALAFVGSKATGSSRGATSSVGVADELLAGPPRPLGLGSTGRTTPMSLTEQLAMAEVRGAPAGRQLGVTLADARWPASDGWVKMSQNVNGVEIHYVRNTFTGAVDDFKFTGGSG